MSAELYYGLQPHFNVIINGSLCTRPCSNVK
jgi:hypothetical protein